MKTKLFVGILFVVSGIAVGQSKKEIMYEINAFKSNTVSKNSYAVPYDQLWDVIYAVGNTEYNQIKRDGNLKAI
ncbi:hypothetical protein ASG38_13080 [Flavobacterium sp. Leaf359]|uniref:hypothetical protein n=1 Tax=Flavobacterium sp. Leaf359 TaxID=1736351 RepID=UPI0006FCBB12|nr:hypothetical protein [Flavobacterium sp. Leaf359]KQS46100.1 hypothetical protein ASG38_13080 [Flavobacterium sp. Leaf359]